MPKDANEKLYVWIRSGWNTEEETVRIDAKQAGNDSPTVYVFIPKRAEIRSYLIDFKAAEATLNIKASTPPSTADGKEAMTAMETIRNNALRNINSLLSEIFSEAKVFQAGGSEIIDSTLKATINKALNNSLQRLYGQFEIADNPNWGKAYSKAKEGAPDALKSIGYNGEPTDNPVCKAIITYISIGKKGAEIRTHFDYSPYGWPGDAIDGALQVLMVSGQLRCFDEQGKTVESKDLERKQIGKSTFKLETITISAPQRIQIRKLFQKLGIKAEAGKESQSAAGFVEKMYNLASAAGGIAPRPERPITNLIDQINGKDGNEQLLFIYEHINELMDLVSIWNGLKERIEARIGNWEMLKKLLDAAGDEDTIKEIRTQVKAIEDGRRLLHEPDMVLPLQKSLEAELRNQLNSRYKTYKVTFDNLLAKLEAEDTWKKIGEEKQKTIREKCELSLISTLNLGSYNELLQALSQYPLKTWNDRTTALKPKFDKALELANIELEPKIQTFDLPKRTFKNNDDINAWLEDIGKQLKKAIENGPIVIR